MKQTTKYLKTRKQKSSIQPLLNSLPTVILKNVINKTSVSKTNDKAPSQSKQKINIKSNNPKKTKKISKTMNKAHKQTDKQIKLKVAVTKIKQNNIKENKTNAILTNLKKKQSKKSIKNTSTQSIKVNGKNKKTTLTNKQNQQVKMNGINHLHPKNIQSNELKNKNKQKIKPKIQMIPVEIITKQNQGKKEIIKKKNRLLKQAIQLNINIGANTNQIKEQNLENIETIVPKKKGRPLKSQSILQPVIKIPSTKVAQITFNEEKSLDEFIEHAIKLRKLKNQKQFYECFSRIIQFIKESWQYGDLSKKIRIIPPNQQILRKGTQIVRGIRKQLHLQQLAANQAL